MQGCIVADILMCNLNVFQQTLCNNKQRYAETLVSLFSLQK